MTKLPTACEPVTATHPLLVELWRRHRFAALDAGSFDAFADAPGMALILFAEDPARNKETLDLAVIAPQIAKLRPGRFRCGVVAPPASRAIAGRYGFRRWPAIVVLRDGGYVGAIDGLRDWSDYAQEIARLADAPVTRPPIGIAVVPAAGTDNCSA